MNYPGIRIREERAQAIAQRHPWIFSGSLERVAADIESGAIVNVCTANREVLGVGVYMGNASIAVRMLTWSDSVITQEWVTEQLHNSLQRRVLCGYGPGTETTGYRMHFAEADSIPGLIIDVYADVVVMQIHSIAAEVLRDWIVEAIRTVLNPRALVERSESAHRTSEGLAERQVIVFGSVSDPVVFSEYSVEYLSFPLTGQKTGFFCDQKDLRKSIRELVRARSVLNLCSYTGAQSIAALKGGAISAHNVDSSQEALNGVEAHRVHHGFAQEACTTEKADVFEWVEHHTDLPFSALVLDPPALIKSQREKASGMKGYHFLNRAVMRAARPNTLFVTSSCSQFFSEDDMRTMLHQAALQSGKILRTLRVVRQSSDHPEALYFPQSQYLKSVIGLLE
jgi:23S rRNA (cytosine1962-C5)-methyltransferase